MAIRTYKVTLDSKNTIAPEPVFLRQGDKTGAVVIDATLMDNGNPVSLSDLTPMFKANTADGQAVIADSTGFNIVNASGGEFTYQVPNALSSVPGKITTAYFSFSDTSGSESTFDVCFIIKKAVDITKPQANDYITIIDGTLNSLHKQIDAMNTDIQTVLNAYNQGDFYNKSETDNRDASTLTSAKSYADSGDSAVLTSAKSYTDNSLSGIVALPETFANLAAIKAKYPNGKNGLMVAADNGHKYIWANNVWTDAGVYQSAGIADNSISPEKLAYSSQQAVLYCSRIIYDMDTKTITIPASGGIAIYWDLQRDADRMYTNTDDVLISVDGMNSAAWKVLFDVSTQTFHAEKWGTELKSSDIFLFAQMTYVINNEIVVVPVGTDKLYVKSANKELRKAGIDNLNLPSARVVGVVDPAIVSSKDNTLVFPKTSMSYGMVIGNKNYDNIIPADGLTIDLSVMDSSTTAWLLLVDVNTNKVFIDKYVNANKYNNSVAILSTIRVNVENNTHKYLFNANFTIVEDGLLFGAIPYKPNQLPKAIIIPGFNIPNVNTVNKTFEWKVSNGSTSSDVVLIVDGVYYPDVVTKSGVTLDLSNLTASTVYFLLFDTVEKHLFFDDWNNRNLYNSGNRYAVVATIRKTPDLSSFVMNIDIPYTVDGTLYGIKKSDNELKIYKEMNNSSIYNFISRQGSLEGYPENSNKAVINAKQNGFNYVRVCVAFTSDNVPVLVHDASINRVARNSDGTSISSTINIADITLEQANTYDWGIAARQDCKGMKIPLLSDFLKICSFKSISPTLEFKPITATDEQLSSIISMVSQYGLANKTYFTSTVGAILSSVNKLNPSINIGLITHPDSKVSVDTALQFKTNINKVRIDIFDTDTPPSIDLLNYASSKGVGIKVGSAYSLANIVKFASMGVTDIEVANVAFPATALSEYYDNL